MKTPFRDYKPETLSMLTALLAAGFTILAGNNGETDFKREDFNTLEDFADELIASDIGYLFVKLPGAGRRASVMLVLGNSPGELAADYTDLPQLAAVLDAESDRWMGQPQPIRYV